MLCDEVVAEGAPGSGCDISVVLPRIAKAQKFVLGPECAAVCEALSEDYRGLIRVFDRCRLPFAETWIEVAQQDRPGFVNAGIQSPMFQVPPRRVGFLLSATRPDLSAWKAHLFWSLETARGSGEIAGISAAALAMRYDMTREIRHEVDMSDEVCERDMRSVIVPNVKPHPGWTKADSATRATMVNHTDPDVPDWGLPHPGELPKGDWDKFYGIVAELARSDWAGEATYLLAVIGLLNARNAVEAEPVDRGKLNRARVKRGRPPLFSHKVLKIAHRQQRRYGGEDRDGHHAPARGHFVRGHFKARKSGVYFWTPHARGDFSRGVIHKEYELK
jgi:hypothetical protein